MQPQHRRSHCGKGSHAANDHPGKVSEGLVPEPPITDRQKFASIGGDQSLIDPAYLILRKDRVRKMN